jgi:hypothetical protein
MFWLNEYARKKSLSVKNYCPLIVWVTSIRNEQINAGGQNYEHLQRYLTMVPHVLMVWQCLAVLPMIFYGLRKQVSDKLTCLGPTFNRLVYAHHVEHFIGSNIGTKDWTGKPCYKITKYARKPTNDIITG